MYPDLLPRIPTATAADLRRLPPPSLASLREAVSRGWRITLAGRCWRLTHPNGGDILTTNDGLRFVGRDDFKT